MTHLGNNIARLRGFKRLTQKELAAKLNMRQQDYSKIENSEVVDDEILQQISDILEIPTELIKQLDSNSVISINQQGGNTGNVFYQISSTDKIVEVYEKLLKEKDEVIELYKKQLKEK